MSEIEIPLALSAISVLITVLNFVYTHFREIAKIQERVAMLEESKKERAAINEEVKKSLTILMDKAECNAKAITRLETKVELFWNAMGDFAVDALHKPHRGQEKLDNLLDKFKAKTITLAELEELQRTLKQMVKERPVSKAQKDELWWATFMIARIEPWLFELKCLGKQERY